VKNFHLFCIWLVGNRYQAILSPKTRRASILDTGANTDGISVGVEGSRDPACIDRKYFRASSVA